jgi:hypothetical protein
MISEYLTECSLGSINLLIMQRASETSHRIILASFVGAVISTLTLWNDNCLPTSTTVVRIFAYVHPSRHEGSHKPYGPGYEAKALAGVEVDLLSIPAILLPQRGARPAHSNEHVCGGVRSTGNTTGLQVEALVGLGAAAALHDLPDRGHHIPIRAGALVRLVGRVYLCQSTLSIVMAFAVLLPDHFVRLLLRD